MLAERRTTPSEPAAVALLLPLLLSMLLAFAGPSRGDFLGVVTTPNATRTAVWNMNSSAGLNPSGIAFSGGNAEVLWVASNTSWTTVSDFTSNGTLDANTTAVTEGIGLLADEANHVANPGFDSGSVWTYANGTNHFVNATWDPVNHAGKIHYWSPSTASLWAAMDSPSGWLAVPNLDTTSSPTANTSMKKEGAASVEIDVAFSGLSGNYVSLQNQSNPQDWSAVNRLVLWVYMNSSAPVVFDLAAYNVTTFTWLHTHPQSLSAGWQELNVNLSELGSPNVRSSLSFISLQVSSSSKLTRTLLFDDLRIGAAKQFSDSAIIGQSTLKLIVTAASPGSARLGLDWRSVNVTNVTASAIVSVAGPGGAYEHALPMISGAPWISFASDISSTVTVNGTYMVNVSVSASVDTTAASNLTVLLDNVSLYFPNRHNGTYLSGPIALGNDSAFDDIAWSAATPAGTSAQLAFRIQPNSPLLDTWGSWSPWSSPGTVPLGGWTGIGIQIRLALNTTNASVSPVVESVQVTSHHRAPLGRVIGGPFAVTSLDFLWWRNLTAVDSQRSGTLIQFYVGNLTSWTPVAPGESIKFYVRTNTIYWRADLLALDTLYTPTLTQVNVTYEYLGPPVKVVVYPGGPVNVTSGHNVTFDATAWDAGGHPVAVPYYVWVTSDNTGGISQNGTYHAGRPGNYTVTATLPGNPYVYATVVVHVLAAGGGTGPANNAPPIDLGGWTPIVLAIAALGVSGFAVYEVLLRRLFSIEDVFLISKDGRLMMHNTRRMRADRDEDILSGMLTAIMSFLRDQDPEENGELKQFTVGGKTTLLERGRNAYLAAVYTGRVPRWAAKDLHRFMEDLDVHFGDAFRTWKGSPDDLQDLKAFTGRFARNVRYRRGLSRERAS